MNEFKDFKIDQQVRHKEGWVGTVIGFTPGTSHIYVKNETKNYNRSCHFTDLSLLPETSIPLSSFAKEDENGNLVETKYLGKITEQTFRPHRVTDTSVNNPFQGKEPWVMPEWMEQFRELIENGAGGNNSEDLMNDKTTTVQNNIPRTFCIVNLIAKVQMLNDLKDEGLLRIIQDKNLETTI